MPSKKLKTKLLTPRQADFYRLLDGKGDVLIRDLFSEHYDQFPLDTQRKMQQRLSFVISSLNTRLAPEGKKIVPGIARGTYRLVSTKTR